MIMIYSPSGLSQNAEKQLEEALERDGARVHYVGNDGTEEFVIVEAPSFEHAKAAGQSLGLKLAFQKSRTADVDIQALVTRRRPRPKKSQG